MPQRDKYKLVAARSEGELQGIINSYAEDGYRLAALTSYTEELAGLASGSVVWIVAAMERIERVEVTQSVRGIDD